MKLILSALVGVGLVFPTQAVSQINPTCGVYDVENCDAQWHKVVEPGEFVINIHYLCGQCLFGQCHPYCIPEEEEEDVKLAYAEVMDAAAAGDVERLVALAPRTNGLAFLNVERNAMQVWNCEKTFIVASLSAPESTVPR